MLNLLKYEVSLFIEKAKTIDKKASTIFIVSAVLFTLSYYFSSPTYYRKSLQLLNLPDVINFGFNQFIYWFITDTFLYLIIPLLIIVFSFKDKISNYGLNINNIKVGFVFILLSIIGFIPIIYYVSSANHFSEYFPLYNDATDNIVIFLVYETLFLLFIFSWEFIFRGFILFGLESKFGLYAIFIQLIPFVLLHNGKPFIETITSILGGLFLGYLALRTRSIIFGFAIHAFILVTLDLIVFIRN